MGQRTHRPTATVCGAGRGGAAGPQAVWLLYFALAACCWWFSFMCHLYVKFILNRDDISRDISWLWRRYAAFSFGLPALIVGAFLGTGSVGALPPGLFCLLRPQPGHDSISYLFYGPSCRRLCHPLCRSCVIVCVSTTLTTRRHVSGRHP